MAPLEGEEPPRPTGKPEPSSDGDIPQIRSRQNGVIRRVRAVAAGKEKGLALLEGERLILDALESGLEFEAILFEPRVRIPKDLHGHPAVRRVPEDGLAGLGSLKKSPGALALACPPRLRALAEFRSDPAGLWICASGLADPANLGAVARAAEAAGARGMLVATQGVRPFHPRALRASMGSLLRLDLVELQPGDELRVEGVHHRFAATRGGVDYREATWPRPLVIWMGDERGERVVEPPTSAEAVTIPMAGRAESLNAATAAALLLFEATRSERCLHS